jgi:hypothetical protein
MLRLLKGVSQFADVNLQAQDGQCESTDLHLTTTASGAPSILALNRRMLCRQQWAYLADTIAAELCQFTVWRNKTAPEETMHLIFRCADLFWILARLNRTGQACGLFNVFGGLVGLVFGLRRLRPFGPSTFEALDLSA